VRAAREASIKATSAALHQRLRRHTTHHTVHARRAGPWLKSALTGIAATGADLGALFALIDLCGWPPTAANVPALLLGVSLQYAGNKYYAFEDKRPPTPRQVGLFGLVEAGTFALNALAFHVLVTVTAAHWLVARAAGSFAVYTAFSYPLWARLFQPRSPASRSGTGPTSAGA
jgi:putative flippase GtrA